MITTINPATEEQIEQYAEYTVEQCSDIIMRSSRAQRLWAAMSVPQRVQSIIRNRVPENEQMAVYKPLSSMATLEMGKLPLQAMAELTKCQQLLEYCIENAEHILRDQFLQPTSSANKRSVEARSYGVILAVMPWNFPYWQVARCALPALMAGNAVVVKHAPNTTGCALLLPELFRSWGFPEHLVSVVIADVDTTQRLIGHGEIAAVTFTGSTQGGRAVARAAGAAGKKVVMELGGSDPYIVAQNALLEEAVPMCFEARMVNAGQSCVAAKRFIVHERIVNEFVERYQQLLDHCVVGNPLATTTTVAPLARADLRATLELQCSTLAPDILQTLVAPCQLPNKGWFVRPGLLVVRSNTARLATAELFGPMATLQTYATTDEALSIANSTIYGLGAAVFEQDAEQAETLVGGLRAGMISVNTPVMSAVDAPFGGVKASGIGRELGINGMLEWSVPTTIVRR
jgi:succinate-semialdehyde dehydrogenase / glutarate-semialdehyde dehydrogenase